MNEKVLVTSMVRHSVGISLPQNGYMVENTSLTIGGVTYNFDANGVCTNK